VESRNVKVESGCPGLIGQNELEVRTKAFALRIIKFVGGAPKNRVTDVLGYQLLRSGTSIGANYREAQKAESADDFIHKLAIVQKEANETKYWLELICDAGIGEEPESAALLQEASELVAIFTTAGKTAKAHRGSRKRK